LRGAVFYFVEGTPPWVAAAPPAQDIIPAIMPGVEHLIEFHGVVRGSCWAAAAGQAPIRLEAGDVILFPQGDAHVVSSAPAERVPAADRGFFFSPRPPQLPFSIAMQGEEVTIRDAASTAGGGAPAAPEGAAAADGGAVTTARLDGGGSGQSTVACGFLGLDARPFNPLLAALPRVLRVPGAALGAGSWVMTFLRTVVEESNRRRAGGEAVLARMTEMLFIEVLRSYVDGLPPEQTGWLAGMRDPAVGRALSLLHEKPAAPWTLERLGARAGLSRSSLHERFVHFIGQPPMQYLTGWRMQLASGLLRDTDAKVLNIALEVGYESEAAFSRAFKRVAGESPGAWRRRKRRDARPAMAGPDLPEATAAGMDPDP
jgi:AraC-like DNA-binding protein